MERIVDFLAEIFDTAPLEYSTLNVYRSALSAYHPMIDGYKVGQHPLVRDLLRGAFNTRPPRPKYAETWDVDSVLRGLIEWGPNGQLSLSQLTHKLAMLMALVSAGRCHELNNLEIPMMQDFGDKVIFRINALTKSRRPGRPYQSLAFMEYTGNKNLDVLARLRSYLQRTDSLRKSEVQKQKLFIACVKLHKPVVTCTIARWLKMVMTMAGIDVGKFQAHSVGGASTSKANKFGLSTQQILERANWAKAKTFYKFYNREVETDVFQDKVLQL